MPELRQRLSALGAKLNEKKFYCQHYTKGCECLGVHIKMDRVYPNDRIVRKAVEKARLFNKCIRKSKVDAILSSLNSYLGIFKNVNGYAQAWKVLNALDKRWWEYIEFDRRRVCLVAKPPYKTNQRIISKYHLHGRKNHDRCRVGRNSHQ